MKRHPNRDTTRSYRQKRRMASLVLSSRLPRVIHIGANRELSKTMRNLQKIIRVNPVKAK